MTDSSDPRPVHPVLLINPRSGGGKAERYDLVAHCRARRIEPIVMNSDDDLASLGVGAVSAGADVIGTAGGDGSQAIGAAVAASYGIPYVCVPAGTRNHFALDIGVDTEDVIGALDAFHQGSERRIDLAQVNGRVFVNNASIGFYGRIVQSPKYRDAKMRTVIETLPALLGPGAVPFDLRFTDPRRREYRTAQLVLVSNNRYQLDPLGGRGARGRMDEGTLGVVVVPDGPPLRRWQEWSVPRFEIDSAATIDVGLDGEAVRLDPPLQFESLPAALRLRTRRAGPTLGPGSDGRRPRPEARRRCSDSSSRWDGRPPEPGRSVGHDPRYPTQRRNHPRMEPDRRDHVDPMPDSPARYEGESKMGPEVRRPRRGVVDHRRPVVPSPPVPRTSTSLPKTRNEPELRSALEALIQASRST